MKQISFGQRLLAFILAMALFVSLVPAVANNAYAASVGDIVQSEETGLTPGSLNTQDTISWPIKIYDYLNDGMLFEYSSAKDTTADGNPAGGYSYGGGRPMPIYYESTNADWNVLGVDYTSAYGYYNRTGNTSTEENYAFHGWGNDNYYSDNIDSSAEGAQEVKRSIVQPVKDVSPMYLRGTYNKPAGQTDNTRAYGWIMDFAQDDDQYHSKEEMRYAVVVYKTGSTFGNRKLKLGFSVSSSAYSSGADISTGSWYESGEHSVSKSDGVWTYMIVDMKTGTLGTKWSTIGSERIAGVSLCWPNAGAGEVFDISHIAFFPESTLPDQDGDVNPTKLAERFGNDAVAFNNDPGEYMGASVTMTHTATVSTASTGTDPATLSCWADDDINFLTNNTMAQHAVSNWTGGASVYYPGSTASSSMTSSYGALSKMTVTVKNGINRYITLSSTDAANDKSYILYNQGGYMHGEAYAGSRVVIVARSSTVDNLNVGFWLGDVYPGSTNYWGGHTASAKVNLGALDGTEWRAFTYDLSDLMVTGYTATWDSIGIQWPGLNASQSLDIAYIFFGSESTASTFASAAPKFLNGLYYKYSDVTTTTTKGSVVQEMWNMGSNQAFTLLYASCGGGWFDSYNGGDSYAYAGGVNGWTNGYYSYQIGHNVFDSSGIMESYRTTAKQNGYVVDNSIMLLNQWSADIPNDFEETGYDVSQLDFGYTLYNTFTKGLYTGGLLQSSQVTYTGMDGESYKIMDYKDTTVGYVATLLNQTLIIPERDYYGYNYNYVKGSPSVEFAEDIDGDGKLDTVNEDLDGDGHLDTVNEDKNGNGVLDMGEDLNLDGNLDVFEDVNFNGVLDKAEDLDKDGHIDVWEDLDYDNVLDPGEDVDGDGKLDSFGATWDGTYWVLDGYSSATDEGKTYLSKLTEDVNGNGVLDKAEDKDNDGELDGVTAKWDATNKVWLSADGTVSSANDKDYFLALTEDANNNGALDPSEDLDGDGHLDLGNEDVDGDGNLDVNEDTYIANGKLDSIDLATALRKQLGITFASTIVSSSSAPWQGTATAKLGSYSDTISRAISTVDGVQVNKLIGPYLKCKDNIKTFYDAAYYLLSNLFVDNSYNQVETDYQYLVMSKAEVIDGGGEGINKEAYVFDAGFTDSEGNTGIVYDREKGTISMAVADAKWEVYYTGSFTTTLCPFLPIYDSDEPYSSEYKATGTPYFREDGAGMYTDLGNTYAERNYNYVMAANGEFVFHYDDGLFFEFEGDDDVYMFINGELVLDIGAAHSITGVKFNMNDYVDVAQSVLGTISGYVPEMADAELEKILPNSVTVDGVTYDKADMRRLHKLNLVDGHSYDIDFYYMERHGWGANMKIATNIVMTDPTLDTEKTGYQGTDANGNPKEVEYGSLIDDSKPVNYSFAITNTGNTKLYKLSFNDPTIGVDLTYDGGLYVYSQASSTQFTVTADTTLRVTGLNGSFELDGQRYIVSSDGTMSWTDSKGSHTATSLAIVYDGTSAQNNIHKLNLYQLNSSEIFTDTTATVILGGGTTAYEPPLSTSGVYTLQLGAANTVPVQSVQVSDAYGGVLDPSDLTLTIDGYASPEDYAAGKPIETITVKVSSNEDLMAFLTNLEDPANQTVTGEEVPIGKNSLYWGSGLWQHATVTISGIYYTLTEEQQEAKVFNNTVYTYGYQSMDAKSPLQGQDNHRVYTPGEPMYYQWANHNVYLEKDRLWSDIYNSSMDETNSLFEQNVDIIALNGAKDSLSMKIVDSDGKELSQTENMYSFSSGMWEVYNGNVMPSGSDKRIVYFENSGNWSVVQAYFWSDTNTSMSSWPGSTMTQVGSSNIYYVEIPKYAEKIIFNNKVGDVGYQTQNISLPADSLNQVEVDSTNTYINVDYTTTGMHMFYVEFSSTKVENTARIPVSFYVTDVQDMTFVLDYGLSTQGLNTAGRLFSSDELLGAQEASRADLMGFSTEKPSYLGIYSAAASELGNINRVAFNATQQIPADTSADASDKSVYIPVGDGRYYIGSEVSTDGTRFTFTGTRYNLDRRIWFTPTDFMDQAMELYLLISVHDTDAAAPSTGGDNIYHVPGPENTTSVTNVIDIGREVQMYKKVTVLPATVVYYEDDFSGMSYTAPAGTFTHHGNGSGSLTQSTDSSALYGQDDTYKADSNANMSGNSMTTIDISTTGEVAAFTFTGTGFEIISRTNSFDSAAFVVTVYDKDNNVVKRLPIVTEFTNETTTCTHSSHNTNGYCTYCGLYAGHSYDLVSGLCESCGAEEAQYYLTVPDTGAKYQMEDGTVTLAFEADTYVTVTQGEGDSAVEFWANGYPGETATSAVLYEKNSLGWSADKLHVPGGVPVTFTVVNSGNGVLSLSYYAKMSTFTDRTLYYDNTNSQWEQPYIYYWMTGEVLIEWPGIPMEKVEGEENLYSHVVPAGATMVIFNNGSGGYGNQTSDLTIPGDGYVYTDGVWSVRVVEEVKDTYSVYFDKPDAWADAYVTYWVDTLKITEDDPTTEEDEYAETVETVSTTVQMSKAEGVSGRYVYELPKDAYQVVFSDSADVSIANANKTGALNVYGDGYRYTNGAWFNSSGTEVLTKTVYFDNTGSDWNNVNAYFWTASNTGMTTWPGVAMTQIPGTNYWKVQVPESATMIIFNNKVGDVGEQTTDLTLVGTKPTYVSGTDAGWVDVVPESENRTLYFQNSEGWSNVYVNYWESNGSAATSIQLPMTPVKGEVWSVEVPASAVGVVFSGDQQSGTVQPTKTVYFQNTSVWETVSLHYWGGADGNTNWPGISMVHLGGGLWTAEIPVDVTSVIFNNGGQGAQTADLTLPTEGNLYTHSDDKWTTYATAEKTTQTVYFNNTYGWDSVYLQTDSFPGVAMTYVSGNMWSAEIPVPTGKTNVVFRSGSKTAELSLSNNGANYWTKGAWEFYVSGADREIYQVPVIRVNDLDYGTYTVKISGMPTYQEGTDYVAIINGANASVAETTTGTLTVPGDGKLYNPTTGTWTTYLGKTFDAMEHTVFFENTNGWEAVSVNDGTSDIEMTQISATLWMAEVAEGTTTVAFTEVCSTGTLTLPGSGHIYKDGQWSAYGEVVEKNTYTLYVRNTAGWTTVNAYYWKDGGEIAWPGVTMTLVEENIWSVEVPKTMGKIIFSQNGSPQTGDDAIPGDDYIYDNSTNTWSTYSPYEVFFENTEGWNEVYAYDGTNTIAMTNVSGNIWMAEISGSATTVEFSGTKASVTGLTLPGDSYSYNAASGEWSVFDQEIITVYCTTNKWSEVYLNDGTASLPMTKLTSNVYGARILASTASVSFNNGNVRDFNEEYSKLLAEQVVQTYLYIDGVRIYQPLGATNDAYTGTENGATFAELRNLILNKYAALATYDVTTSTYTGSGYTWTENRNGNTYNYKTDDFTVYEGNKLASMDEYLRIGPNNEVYMAGNQRKEAIIFYVTEVAGASDRTVQIAARALDQGLFTQGVSTGVGATLYQGSVVNMPDGSTARAWTAIATLRSGTEQYYTIDYSNCPYTVDSNGLKTYEIALYVRSGMASFSSVKYNGFTIPQTMSGEGEATTLVYDNNHKLVNAATGEPVVAALNYESVSYQMASVVYVNADGSMEVGTSGGSVTAPAVTKPTLSLDYPTLSLDDEIKYNIYFSAANMDDVVEMGLITFGSALADGTMAEAVEIIPGYEVSGESYMVQSNGIAAKEMGDTLFFKAYARLSDGSYVYSELAGYNAVAYAKGVLESSTDLTLKALAVALMNYGTQAQQFFGHNTDSLMNSFLTSGQQALISTYSSSMMSDVVLPDSSKTGAFVRSLDGFTALAPTVSLDGALSINYYFTTAFMPEGIMTMYYWTAEDYAAAEALSVTNASGAMVMEQTGIANQFCGTVSGIAAKDMGDTVYVVGVYECDGVTYTTGVLGYHVGSYFQNVAASTESTNALAAAAAVYGYYAEKYFGTN